VGNNINELKLTTNDLNDILHSYKVFKDVGEEVASAEILEVDEVAEEMVDETEEVPEVVEKVKKRSAFQSKKDKFINEYEIKAKQNALNLSLRAYVDSCVQNGMVNRGYLAAIRYRWKSKKAGKYGLKVNDVFIFNQLMYGYAEKENLLKVMEIYTILGEDSIKPNAQTFAVVLDCFGKVLHNQESWEKNNIFHEEGMKEALNNVRNEAQKHHISFDTIMNKTVFVNNQRDFVLAAIRHIEPNYEPNYQKPELLYNNPLVKSLNENVRDFSYDPLTSNEKCVGSEIMDSKGGFTKEQLEAWSQEQILNELNSEVVIKSCLNYPNPSQQTIQYRQRLNEIQKKWREAIISSFNRNYHILRMEELRTRGNQNLLPFIRSLEVEQYVNLILTEVRRLTDGSESFTPHMIILHRSLGEKVEMRYHAEQKMKLGVLQKTNEIYNKYCDVMLAGNSSDNPRQSWQRIVHQSKNEGASVDFQSQPWSAPVKVAIGKFLYSIIVRDLKLDLQFIKNGKHGNSESSIPAFFSIFRSHGRMVKEELKPHPLLMKLYRISQQEEIVFDVNLMPMVCPPQPYWTWYNGGYLVAKTDLLRLPPNCHQQLTEVNETPLQNLYPILDALNQQQSIPWRINTEILDIALEVFRKGGDKELEVAELPSNLEAPTPPEKDQKLLSNEEKFKFFREKLTYRKKQSEMYSLWCDAHYRLSLANHFRDRPFWLPLNLDFRGRVYSLPPHLTHLGADLGRSLMMFHNKKKLGVDGLSWLKLHCINLTGLKKRDSVRERLLFAEEVIDEIFDSADNPLDGRRWWTQSDEPWQTLAVCKEIAHAIRSGKLI
jgi:DNA-directed RNA polymerase